MHRNVVLANAIDPSSVTITIKETQEVLRIGNALMDFRYVTLEDWMTYALNDPGAANIHELVVVTGVETIGTYADTDLVFNGGYVILLGSDMNAKYIVDRWGNEWNPVDGWTVNAGAWSYGANDYVSYVKDRVAAGDIMILGGQYDNGLATGASYRDVLGNQVFSNIGAAIYTGDHRAVDITTAIDPTTVTFAIQTIE